MNIHAFLDNLTVKAATLSKFRYFSSSIESPEFSEHLEAIQLDVPRIQGEGFYEVPAYSLVGALDPAFHVAQWRGSEFPTLIYHHGNNERPFDYGPTSKNTFKNIFLSKKDDLPVNLISLRAAFHHSLKDYTQASTHLSNWIAMLAASTALVENLARSAHERLSSPIVVSGLSLGGWVANLHRAHCGSADIYCPMLAGAALDDVFLTSTYRTLTGENALGNPSALKSTLNFEIEFLRAPEMNVYPLLARYDQIIRYERQKQSYAKHPLTVIEKGHVTTALASDELRSHVMKAIYNH
jgi:predicted esterase YcpF (UPF0227 family)